MDRFYVLNDTYGNIERATEVLSMTQICIELTRKLQQSSAIFENIAKEFKDKDDKK